MRETLRGYAQYFESIGHRVPVLCLPPFPFDHRFFKEQLPLQEVARLVLPDYRGTGRSELTPGPYSMTLLAQDMFALLDHLKLPHVIVLGVSLGGYVALTMAAENPERILGLILADSRAEADTQEMLERRQQSVDALRTQGPEFLEDRVRTYFGKTTRHKQPALLAEMQGTVRQQPGEGLAQLTLAMAQRPDRCALLPQLKVPTLVLCGEEDAVSPPEGMRDLAAEIPDAVFQVIPQAGHLAALEQPVIFNQLVHDFILQWPLHS